MIISLDNLKAGIRWWCEEKGEKSDWGYDVLNAEYYHIYGARAAGVPEKWWTATVDRLGRWHAYRGPKPPNTRAAILQGGEARLKEIGEKYDSLVKAGTGEPCITDLCWEDIAPLFAIAFSIKNSPVFAGKMCHFLFPKLFVVMDNLATGVFGDYEFYWRGMKDEWGRFKGKTQANSLLTEAIKSDKPLHRLYPFETKIMELSHIGYNHG